jgi:DNA-binding NarL/FixJ family response regulator
MILLCSKNQIILNHWKSALSENVMPEEALSITELKSKLRLLPDMVILHTALPGFDTLDDLKILLKNHADIKFLFLSDKPDEQTAFQLLRCGACGYSNTYLSTKLLLEAVTQIKTGEIWMGRRLTRFLSKCLLEDLNNEETEGVAEEATIHLTHLTPREKEVAKRVAHGCSNKCIANKLNLTERTVKAHLTSIFEKTKIKDRVHLALMLNSHKYE